MNESEAPETRAQYWKLQIDAWQASGQSQQAFCKANDLDYSRFGYWLRKLRRQGVVADAARRRSGFVPVVAASAASCVFRPNVTTHFGGS